MKQLEFEVSRDTLYNLSKGGEASEGLRVRYRPTGVRRWTNCLVMLDDPVSDEDMPRIGLAAAQKHYRSHAGSIAAAGGVEKEERVGGVTYDGRDAERYQGQIVARKEPQMTDGPGCSHPASAIRWNPEQQVIQCQACGEAMLVTPSGDVYPTLGGVEKEGNDALPQ